LNAALAVLEKRPHRRLADRMARLHIGQVPSRRDPLGLVDQFPRVDCIGTFRRHAEQRIEHVIEKCRSLAGIGQRLCSPAFHPIVAGGRIDRLDRNAGIAETKIDEYGKELNGCAIVLVRVRKSCEQVAKVLQELCGQRARLEPPGTGGPIQPRRARSSAVSQAITENEPPDDGNSESAKMIEVGVDRPTPVRRGVRRPPCGRRDAEIPTVIVPGIVDSNTHASLIRGASPLGLPHTLSRAPLRRRAPFAWLARALARAEITWFFESCYCREPVERFACSAANSFSIRTSRSRAAFA